MGKNRHVTPFYFCTFFKRELAGLRARSLSQGKSSGRIAGAGRLKEVVARKALKGGEGIQRRERNQISAKALFQGNVFTLDPLAGSLLRYSRTPWGGIERSCGQTRKASRLN